MRIVPALRTLWRWIAHISTAQWVYSVIAPISGAAFVIGAIFQFLTDEPLRVVIPVVVLCACLCGLLGVAVAIWRNQRPSNANSEITGRASLNLRLHPDYIAEAARQKAIADASRRNAADRLINGSFEDVADRILKDRVAQEEAERQMLIEKVRKPNARTAATKWLPLHQALKYLTHQSEWAFKQARPTNEKEFDEVVSEEFVEALARGEVQSRGKRGKGFFSNARATEPIPTDYWISGFIQPHGEIVIADDKRCAAGNPGSPDTYVCIVINMDDLKKRWPASAQLGLSPLAAFCEVNGVELEIETRDTEPASNVLVQSFNQSGGQTAHTIVNREPDPVPSRKLSVAQAKAMRSVLEASPIKGSIMEIQFASAEQAYFSAQIVTQFQQCGWARSTMCTGSRKKPGPTLVGYQGEKSEAYLVAVEALEAAGIEFDESSFEGPEADIVIQVGLLKMTPFQRAADQLPD